MLLSLSGPGKVLDGLQKGEMAGGSGTGFEWPGKKGGVGESLWIGRGWAAPACSGPKQVAFCPFLRTGLPSPSSPTTLAPHSPLNEFLEHIPSEVLTNLLNVWLQKETEVGN
jgi:hypothetical protein